MRILGVLSAVALALTIGSATVRASTIEFAGTTTGCFDLSCSSKLGTLKFTGTSFDKSIVDPNTSVALNLGKFTLTSTLFEPFNSIFDLTIHFTKPGTTTVNVDADVKGLVTLLAGVVHIDFDPETLSFGGRSYTLDVSDVWLSTLGPLGHDTETLKGTITINAAVPEPSTWAMIMLGVAGLGYMANRRRQIDETVPVG